MALKANIPILLASFDYPSKTVVASKPFYPTGNFKEDMKEIFDFYRDKQGKFPKAFPEMV